MPEFKSYVKSRKIWFPPMAEISLNVWRNEQTFSKYLILFIVDLDRLFMTLIECLRSLNYLLKKHCSRMSRWRICQKGVKIPCAMPRVLMGHSKYINRQQHGLAPWYALFDKLATKLKKSIKAIKIRKKAKIRNQYNQITLISCVDTSWGCEVSHAVFWSL